jgi:hypothetical protein
MPVLRYRHDLEDLLDVSSPVVLEVGPTWAILGHGGSITDRTFPHTNLPCTYYLEQGSEVRVMVPAASSADIRRAVVARVLLVMNMLSIDGNPSPYALVYEETPGCSFSADGGGEWRWLLLFIHRRHCARRRGGVGEHQFQADHVGKTQSSASS